MTTLINKTEDYLDIEDKILSFHRLVDSMATVKDQKKTLWKDIYSNAVRDRKLAFMMYQSITENLDDPAGHSIHGPTIAKYIERLTKSNDQVMRLCEIVSSALEANEETPENINADDFYNMLDRDRDRDRRRESK